MIKLTDVIEVFWVFLKLGLTSFGGPIAHIGYFHTCFIKERQWLDETQFANLVAVCQCLPGPASSQLGFALGWLRAGWLGAIAAFMAFTLPSVLMLIIAAHLLSDFSHVFFQTLISSLMIVAFVVVFQAVWGMAGKLCQQTSAKIIALLSMIYLLFSTSSMTQIFVIVCGGLMGGFFCQQDQKPSLLPTRLMVTRKVAMGLLGLFFLLLVGLPFFGEQNLWAQVSHYYHVGALVFGGGHVVLPLLESSFVGDSLSQEKFLAGYGVAQAMPGPLFSLSAYMGYLSNQNSLLGACIAVLSIFLPGFLLLISVLPFWQSLASIPRFFSVMAGINAAVVGMLSAALYNPIILHALNSIEDWVIALVGLVLLMRFNLKIVWVIFWCVASKCLITQVL